ncbi:MAG: 50S ribosomal protein L10 [Phycisphaerales bacterium]|nr:50S ribosomal protein L10 [Phycisphaerales bacterium]
MSKPVKDLITEEYKASFAAKHNACVVSVIGMEGVAANKFRGDLKKHRLSMQVVKNSLARRAFADTPLSPLGAALRGPCALVVSEEDSSAIDLAKILVGFKKDYPKLELGIGILDGDADLIDVERLANMKGREELLADLAMMIASPARSLAGCLAGPGGRLAGCFKAMAEKETEDASAAA